MTPERKLKAIKKIFERTYKDKDGYRVTTHMYYNLMGARIDLERDEYVDRICLKTIRDIEKRLGQISNLLEK